MKTILLTGGTGFLGIHLLKKIINDTKYNIVLLKRSFSNISRIQSILNNERIQVYDIDKTDISENFEENIIFVIFHCATEYGRNNKSCYNVLSSNLMFPINLIELAIIHGVEVFVNTDSYFNKLSKKSLNLWLKYFSNKIKIINLVLEHIYGEYDSASKFVEHTIRKIAIKKVESIDLTYGEQKRDFIYIEDVCKIYMLALDYALRNNITLENFDVGTGIAISIKDFVYEIKKISNSSTVLNFGAVKYRDDEIMSSCAEKTLCKTLAWKEPFTQIDEGLKKIISIYNGGANANI